MTKLKFPSIKDVAWDLRSLNKLFNNEDCVDVRLQVYPDGNWAIRYGDSQYDQDHRGYWGLSCIPGNGKRFKSMDTAKELIYQAREQYFQGTEICE